MSYSEDMTSTEPIQDPNTCPDPAESSGPSGWMYSLNAFLERSFLKADRDTGC